MRLRLPTTICLCRRLDPLDRVVIELVEGTWCAINCELKWDQARGYKKDEGEGLVQLLHVSSRTP